MAIGPEFSLTVAGPSDMQVQPNGEYLVEAPSKMSCSARSLSQVLTSQTDRLEASDNARISQLQNNLISAQPSAESHAQDRMYKRVTPW